MSISGVGTIAGNRQQQAQRCEPRTKVFEPVTIAVGADVYPAHLLDVSRSGARAHCRVTVDRTSRVIVHADGLALIAEVMWVRDDDRFGLRFLTPLATGALDRIVRAGTIRVAA